jgi:hypothetical protein
VVHVLIYSLWALLIVGGLVLLLARSLVPMLGGVGAALTAGGVLLVAAFLYIRAYRRARLHEQTIIARPVEEVFQCLATEFFATRAARMPEAAPPGTAVRVEQTSIGPLGVGTTGREVITRGDQQSTWTFLVSIYEPPRRFAVVVSAPARSPRFVCFMNSPPLLRARA